MEAGEYTTEDLKESLDRVDLPSPPVKCLYAFGVSDDGWEGGFLLGLKDGNYAVLTGWCDYTGWGCQDGAEVAIFNNEVDARNDYHVKERASVDGDADPVDLNRWLSKRN